MNQPLTTEISVPHSTENFCEKVDESTFYGGKSIRQQKKLKNILVF